MRLLRLALRPNLGQRFGPCECQIYEICLRAHRPHSLAMKKTKREHWSTSSATTLWAEISQRVVTQSYSNYRISLERTASASYALFFSLRLRAMRSTWGQTLCLEMNCAHMVLKVLCRHVPGNPTKTTSDGGGVKTLFFDRSPGQINFQPLL